MMAIKLQRPRSLTPLLKQGPADLYCIGYNPSDGQIGNYPKYDGMANY